VLRGRNVKTKPTPRIWKITFDSPPKKDRNFEAFETVSEIILEFLRKERPKVIQIELTPRQSRALTTGEYKRSDLVDAIKNRRYTVIRAKDKRIMKFTR
jgi:hypothetical protein